MNAELMLAHFDRISDAPDAVPRLRRFVLDLAVRGKLVEQDPADEPATQLLSRIQAERVQLARMRQIPKIEPIVGIAVDEPPFEAPSGWVWTRLSAVSKRIHYGFTASANTAISNVRLLRITDIQNNTVDWPTVPGCEIPADDIPQYELAEGDILIARTGGTIGKTFLVEKTPVIAVFASYLIRVQKASELYDRYLKMFLESPVYWRQLQDGSRGAGQPNVNGQTLGRMLVAVAPREEQRRIVAKVDELMALCDRLEAGQRERESRRDQLAASTHHHLNNGADAEALRSHAQFFIRHLPRLTASPDQIKQLRQTILNLAVRGKLVPQDPKDEPADNLLKRIRAREIRGKTKSRKNETTSFLLLESQEAPFQGPPNWAWVQLREIGETQTGTTPPSGNRELFGDYIPFVKPANLGGGAISLTEDGISKAGIEYSRLIMRSSVLMVCIGATLGKAAITDRDICCNQQINAITPYLPEMASFTLVALRSSYFQKLAWLKAGVGTLPIISKGKWEQLPVPVPPLAEQHRIVAKVDRLMALCDQLESRLATAQTEASRILESVLHNALHSPAESALAVPKHSPDMQPLPQA
jgi:type I restriction enzyme S subunit